MKPIKPAFHNTINLDGKTLDKAMKDAHSIEQLIYNVFKKYKKNTFTPCELHDQIKEKVLLTSIRRGITNLTNEGKLVKTDIQRMGKYGKPNYAWKVKY